jgi:hypothetical protein
LQHWQDRQRDWRIRFLRLEVSPAVSDMLSPDLRGVTAAQAPALVDGVPRIYA